MEDKKFEGFDELQKNYCPLPLKLIANLHLIDSLAELKVVLYIIRHTLGWRDSEKRISLSEFCHGRRRRNGTHLDNGVGMSVSNIRNGLYKAVEHGFIEVVEEANSARGQSAIYALRMAPPK